MDPGGEQARWNVDSPVEFLGCFGAGGGMLWGSGSYNLEWLDRKMNLYQLNLTVPQVSHFF